MAKEAEEKPVPGSHLKSVAGIRVGTVYFLAFIFAMAWINAGGMHTSIWSLGGAMVCLAITIICAMAWIASKYDEAFDHLAGKWREAVREAENNRKDFLGALEQANKYRGFIGAFRPTPEQIDSMLRQRAIDVQVAREEVVTLYRRGLQMTDTSPMGPTSESEVRFLKRSEQLKHRVLMAQEKFDELSHLAKSQDYSVKTWQEYVGIAPGAAALSK